MIEVSIYNIELERQATIYTFISMMWEENYNEEGSFQLECVLTDDSLDIFQLEWYVGCTGHDTLMVIKSVQVNDNTVVVNGFTATHIFSDRVSTTTISNENAESAMRTLFTDMAEYPQVELDEESGLEDTFTQQTSDGTLLEYFETIAQACDIGFRLRHDKTNKKLLFQVYKGEDDISAKYSTLYGNMGNIVYTLSSQEYKNVAVVAGQGEGDDRITVYAGETDATGSDRREMYVDARNEQQEDDETDEEYEDRLIAYGEEKLLSQLAIESISFTEADQDAELGDMAYCKIPEIGLDVSVRITGIEEVMQKNTTERTLTLGTPVILKRY